MRLKFFIYFRYTSNGSLLYSACDDGKLRRYRRYPDHHEYLGEVYAHKGDIQDLDISPYDECILFKILTSLIFFFSSIVYVLSLTKIIYL